MAESTTVDIVVEESQCASVNVDTSGSNHDVHIQVLKSEHSAMSVQLLDSACASVSANVMESEHATINVKILGSTDTTTTSSSKGACMGVVAEHPPFQSTNITTEHNYSKVETTHRACMGQVW